MAPSPMSSASEDHKDPTHWADLDVAECMRMEGTVLQRCERAMQGISEKLHYEGRLGLYLRMEILDDIWQMLHWLTVRVDDPDL